MTLPDPITPGLYLDILDADYRKAPGMAQSTLKPILRSPAHFQEELKKPRKQTEFMLQGSVFDQLLFNPELPPFWVVKPAGLKLSTTEGKAWKERVKGVGDIIDQEDFEDAQNAVEAVRNDPSASMAIAVGNAQVSAFSRFTLCGLDLLLKGRLDFLNEGPSIIDLKLTDDAQEEAWSRKIEDMGYHIQAAYYLDLVNAVLEEQGLPLKQAFVHIVAERKPPYAVKVYTMEEETLGIGRHLYVKALMTYDRCMKEGYWPKYDRRITPIGIPKYARRNTTPIYGFRDIAQLTWS